MKPKLRSSDPDILASQHALRRAAASARKLARATGTPLYVLRAGRVVNVNAPKTARKTA